MISASVKQQYHLLHIKWIMEIILKKYLNLLKIKEKNILLMFLIKNDADLLNDSEYLKTDINRLIKDFKTILMEQNEDYLDHIKNEEESKIEKMLNKSNRK